MLLASCAAFALLIAACGGSAAPSASPAADRVAGVVNGQDLRASSVGVVLAERRLLGQSAAGAFTEAVDRELVRQEAVRLGVSADASGKWLVPILMNFRESEIGTIHARIKVKMTKNFPHSYPYQNIGPDTQQFTLSLKRGCASRR